MISKKTLNQLIVQKLKDADVLLSNRRYSAAIYLSGYALEIALKLKICKIFKFAQGFPENKAEFKTYQNIHKSAVLLTNSIAEIRDIRHHNLNKLLFYSGVELKVKQLFFTEWLVASGWAPEMRYIMLTQTKGNALQKVNAIKRIINGIK